MDKYTNYSEHAPLLAWRYLSTNQNYGQVRLSQRGMTSQAPLEVLRIGREFLGWMSHPMSTSLEGLKADEQEEMILTTRRRRNDKTKV